MEYLELGPVPSEETCQQVGTAGYDSASARAECKRFIDRIKQVHGDPPSGARLGIRPNYAHDFGTYYEVAVYYDSAQSSAMQYAFAVEADTPTTWS